MLFRISPYRIAEHDLVIRPFLGSDHVAEVAGLRAGWILHASAAEPGPFWWWSLTGPCCTMCRVEREGRCASLEEAKQQLTNAYNRWLKWALIQPGDISWTQINDAARKAPAPSAAAG